jgi:hypothetical protein
MDLLQFNWNCLAYRAITAGNIQMGDSFILMKDSMDMVGLSCPSSSFIWPNKCACQKDIRFWRKGLR